MNANKIYPATDVDDGIGGGANIGPGGQTSAEEMSIEDSDKKKRSRIQIIQAQNQHPNIHD